MRRKNYQKPTMEIIEAEAEYQILATSTYTTTTGLKAMDNDVDLGDGILLNGTGIWSMGADEDL